MVITVSTAQNGGIPITVKVECPLGKLEVLPGLSRAIEKLGLEVLVSIKVNKRKPYRSNQNNRYD